MQGQVYLLQKKLLLFTRFLLCPALCTHLSVISTVILKRKAFLFYCTVVKQEPWVQYKLIAGHTAALQNLSVHTLQVQKAVKKPISKVAKPQTHKSYHATLPNVFCRLQVTAPASGTG